MQDFTTTFLSFGILSIFFFFYLIFFIFYFFLALLETHAGDSPVSFATDIKTIPLLPTLMFYHGGNCLHHLIQYTPIAHPRSLSLDLSPFTFLPSLTFCPGLSTSIDPKILSFLRSPLCYTNPKADRSLSCLHMISVVFPSP